MWRSSIKYKVCPYCNAEYADNTIFKWKRLCDPCAVVDSQIKRYYDRAFVNQIKVEASPLMQGIAPANKPRAIHVDKKDPRPREKSYCGL